MKFMLFFICMLAHKISGMLPLFYCENLNPDNIVLNEETSKHIAQVLRMEPGETIQLTDGKGILANALIIDNHKKKCSVNITEKINQISNDKKITIAISLLKNASRLEWFLEKATEVGIAEVVPLICERTEKQYFRSERMNGILISAMLQSHQYWKPNLLEPVKYSDYIQNAKQEIKLIAHCENSTKINLKEIEKKSTNLILIGPEGDFTSKEIEQAKDFIPVSLGENRLRTETAGIVAAVLLCS